MGRGQSSWDTFKNSVSWRDITLGFIIPKVIFYIAMNKPWLTAGAAVSIFWCVCVFAIQYMRLKKTNFWALLGLSMILIQMIPVIIKNDPNVNFIASAVDSILFGAICLGSLIWGKPIIRIFAEKTGARKHIPEIILNSPYYNKAWVIITVVWAVVYLVESAIQLFLALNNYKSVLAVDVFSGWPTMVLLIFFTIQFPKLYWARIK